MSSIIKSLDKRSGITYVYSSESYWDKEKKAPRNRRTLIGKIDPETGEIVPTNGARRKAMERKAAEAKQQIATAIDGLDKEQSALSEKYIAALEQFDIQLQGIEEDIQTKRREIAETRQSLQNSAPSM